MVFLRKSNGRITNKLMVSYKIYPDSDLLRLLQSGDHLAFAEIYDRYKLILHHHAWTKLGNKTEAQDTIQEVFSALWSKREDLSIHHNLAGYLYTSVRNHILNLMARKEVQDKYLHSLRQFSSEQVQPDFRIRENMLHQTIEKEIAALPPKMRQVFELSRKQHLSHKEIAAIMGTSEETIKKQIKITLKQLRSRLGLTTYLYLLLFFKF